MRRPVRFFVHKIAHDSTLWLDDGEGEESSVVSVTTFDAMGHGRDSDRQLRVVIMQLGAPTTPSSTSMEAQS